MTELPTEAVFFDLDGTLIDTAPDMGGALNRVLHRHRKPEVEEARYRPWVSHGSMALLQLGFDADQADMEALRTEFLSEYESGVAQRSQLFEGIPELLEQLEQQQIPWGIITNKPEYLTLQLLDALALTARCCCIIGADTASHAKPHPAPMEMACALTRVNARRCLYLGDAERDIQAGRSVGMTTLIAGWGYIGADDTPASWQADGWLDRPADTHHYLAI